MTPRPKTEPDPHDRSDATAYAAAVAQCQDGACSGEQRTSGMRTEARYPLAAADQRCCDVAAELHGHVAAVRHRDEEKPRVAPSVGPKPA